MVSLTAKESSAPAQTAYGLPLYEQDRKGAEMTPDRAADAATAEEILVALLVQTERIYSRVDEKADGTGRWTLDGRAYLTPAQLQLVKRLGGSGDG